MRLVSERTKRGQHEPQRYSTVGRSGRSCGTGSSDGLWVVRKAQREQLGNSDELARLQAATTTGTVPKDVDRDRWAALLRGKSRSRIDWYYAAALAILVVVSSFAEAREPGSFGAAEFGAHFVYLLPALLIFGRFGSFGAAAFLGGAKMRRGYCGHSRVEATEMRKPGAWWVQVPAGIRLALSFNFWIPIWLFLWSFHLGAGRRGGSKWGGRYLDRTTDIRRTSAYRIRLVQKAINHERL